MHVINSECSLEQLRTNWDEFTSPARFAGNDEMMDTIYIAKRKQDFVYLIKKAQSTRDPFATVFRGKLVEQNGKSAIVGSFSKRILDYILLMILALADVAFWFYLHMSERLTSSITGGCILFGVLLILLAIPLPKTKKTYRAFLQRIADHNG